MNLNGLLALLALGMASLLLAPQPVTAQEQMVPGLVDPEQSRVKDYGRPGYPRVTVYIWGNADKGVWTVEQGTGLLEYLSVAARGRFTQGEGSRVENILRVYRDGSTSEEPVFEASLEDIFSQRTNYPKLQNGDVLVIESVQRSSAWNQFREAMNVLGTLTSVVSLGLIIWD